MSNPNDRRNRSKLSAEKLELLAYLLAEEDTDAGLESVPGQQILPRQSLQTADALPLSFAQQRLWFLQQLEPESPFYNVPAAVRLMGSLNVAAFEQSINEILRRHEVLRTAFVTVEGQPQQAIVPTLSVSLPIVDLQALPQSDQHAEAVRLAMAEAQRPFNLTQAPLLRVTLLRLAAADHVVLFTLHHIVADGWSTDVLVRELAILYNAFATGTPSPLPDLPIQYADFALWQRQWLQGDVLQRQLAYWKQQLDGIPVLELPTDCPRPNLPTYRGATQSLKLSRPLLIALKTLSQQHGTTLFMTLLAAFQVLLYRYTGQTDLSVGTPIANRTHPDLEGLIGFFVNTLVLRTQLSGNLSVAQLLDRVREVTLSAYAHQDLPFEMVVEALQPERDMSHSSLFQVMFILQNAPTSPPSMAGLRLSPLQTDAKTATFDLTLSVTETAEGLEAIAEYATDLFHASTIQRLLGHFQTLLEGIVADPNQCLADLPLLTFTEQNLQRQWNHQTISHSPLPIPHSLCIHQLFEAQVEQTPEAIAVIFEAQSFTYRELNQQANQLAHYLKNLGIQPETLVGICMERSPLALVAILAVLKAGGAYVPIDPHYPEERIAFMLTDAQISVLLAQSQVAFSGAQGFPCPHVIDLDRDWHDIAESSQDNPVSSVSTHHLAYVIYTSGSTGQAKGVMVEHHSLVNAYWGWETAYQLRSVATSHLQMANLAFDVFTGDWVRALCSGGKLVLCPKETLLDPPMLYRLMQQAGVNCGEFVPVVLRSLMQYLKDTDQRLDFMQLVICGSDSWFVDEYTTFQHYCGSQTRLINSFGVTEATIDSSYFEGSTASLSCQQVPIGHPFANVQFYILDHNLRSVPIGIPGELYISGAGLARGYFNRPNLTAERFIPNPFCGNGEREDTPPPRLYKTGDRARYLPEGNIEFLGRMDHQVKLRGFRIELGEIEAVLVQHPTVQQAVVQIQETRSGNPQLVAYLVPSEPTPSFRELSHELRRFMQARLPNYMIPAAFVQLETLPLTPNSKLDRRSLPTPDWTDISEEADVAPRTPTEELLAGLWCQVLGIERVGVHDNFFERGGHSLLATQLVSRLRDAFQVELPLRYIFESPTIATLAEPIEQLRHSQQGVQTPPIPAASRQGHLPLSFAQQRLWFLDQLQPGNPAYNVPETVRLQGQLNLEALHYSLDQVIQRHEVLRTAFAAIDGKPVQVITPTLSLAIPVIDLQHLAPADHETEVQQLAIAEIERPFNLAQAPLLRVTLLRLNDADHVVLLTLHHIISDASSTSILVRELATFYADFTNGQSASLPDLPIQYADFAMWQQQWLQSEGLETQLAYWTQQLADAPTLLDLPTDRPRPTIQSFQGGQQPFKLSIAQTASLTTLCQQEGVTLFMLLLAAFKTVLYFYSKQTDLIIGTPIANRNRTELEHLIGFFVNTLVLRTDLSGNPNFREVLHRIRQVTLAAYDHQDLPIEKLIEALPIQRDLSYNPLFQVWFVLQNAPSLALELPGLMLSPVQIESQTTRHDLALSLWESAEGLQGIWEYRKDLFNASTITRLSTHFETILNCIITQPNISLDQLIKQLADSEAQEKRTIANALETNNLKTLKHIKRKPVTSRSPYKLEQ